MTLSSSKHTDPVPRESRAVMAQVGWLGFSGDVYSLEDEPITVGRESGVSPLYIQIGTWEDLGGGHWGIKD